MRSPDCSFSSYSRLLRFSPSFLSSLLVDCLHHFISGLALFSRYRFPFCTVDIPGLHFSFFLFVSPACPSLGTCSPVAMAPCLIFPFSFEYSPSPSIRVPCCGRYVGSMVRVRSLCITSIIGSAHTQTLTLVLQCFHPLTQYPILLDPRMSPCTYAIPHILIAYLARFSDRFKRPHFHSEQAHAISSLGLANTEPLFFGP